MTGALQGVRVIDLATVVMGPYATQIMGDLGAEVIKVESGAGDLARRTQPQRHAGMGALALNVNRNKRSLVLDLKSDAGHAAFLDLVATADVLVTNMRPGALHRLGLDADTLTERFPGLVYCRAQGFRSDSELADRAAYDEIVQAASGMVDLMDRTVGIPAYAPTILADKVCALTIAYSAMAALVHQRATGRGQVVEVPMADTMLAFNLVEHLSGQTFVGDHEGPTGFNRSMAAGHEAVATADGRACILPYTPVNIDDFFRAAGRDDLVGDPRFADSPSLAAHQEDLYRLIRDIAPERTTDEWGRLCAAYSVPFAPVLALDDAADDPYVAAGDVLTEADHPTEGRYRTIGFPVRLSDTPGGMRTPCPSPGQDSVAVLRELGRTDDEIRELVGAPAADPTATHQETSR